MKIHAEVETDSKTPDRAFVRLWFDDLCAGALTLTHAVWALLKRYFMEVSDYSEEVVIEEEEEIRNVKEEK